MQQGGDRAQMNPMVFWVVIGVVVLAAVALGFKLLGGGSGSFQKGGSEELMNKVKAGGKLYEPPAVALPPEAQGRMGGAGGGGYNLQMPTPTGPPTGAAPGGAPPPPGPPPTGR